MLLNGHSRNASNSKSTTGDDDLPPTYGKKAHDREERRSGIDPRTLAQVPITGRSPASPADSSEISEEDLILTPRRAAPPPPPIAVSSQAANSQGSTSGRVASPQPRSSRATAPSASRSANLSTNGNVNRSIDPVINSAAGQSVRSKSSPVINGSANGSANASANGPANNSRNGSKNGSTEGSTHILTDYAADRADAGSFLQTTDVDILTQRASNRRGAPPNPQDNQPPNQGWRTKAILTAIAIGVLPVTLLGMGAYLATNHTIAQGVADTEKRQAVQASEALSRFMGERFQDVSVLANLPILTDAKTRKATSDAEKQQFLETLKQTYGVYDGITVLDLNGNPILQSAGPAVGNQRSQAYFQTALKTTEPTVGESVGSNSATMLMLAAPVKDQQTGQVIAVVTARLNADRLASLTKVDGQANDRNFIYDATGTILLSSDPAMVGQSLDTQLVGSKLLRPAAAATLVGEEFRFGTALFQSPENLAQLPVAGLAKTTPIGNRNLNWGVAYAANPQTVVQAQRDKVLLLLLATLGLGGIATAIALFSAQRAAGAVESQMDLLQRRQQTLQQKQTRLQDRSKLLSEIVETMRQSLRTEDILNTTVSELRYALHADRVIVYEFNDDWNGVIIAESVTSGGQKILGSKVIDPFREGLIERYRNGRVRAMDDVYAAGLSRCHRELLEGFNIRASIVAPILQNGELIGLLCAHQCSGPRRWAEEDVDLFAKLSSQLGFVLEQATLIQKQSRSVERFRILNELVDNMRRSIDESDILNITVSELRYALNTDRVIVYRFHDDWNGTIVAESVALGCPKILGEVVRDPFQEGLIDRYKNGRVRAMNDIEAEGLTDCHREILRGFQIRASIVAPILQNGKLIGLLCAHQCLAAREWEVADIDLFARLATQLGFALDQAASLRKQTRSAERSRFLNEIVSTMRRSLKQEDILQTTVSELRYALNTDRVIVYNFQDDWLGTVIAESVGLTWAKILGEFVEDPLQEGLIDRYKNGRVRVMNDVGAESLTACHQEILDNFQIRASIVAPILQNGVLTGLLCAHQCAGPREWTEEDVDLFTKLAIQLGFALDQAAVLSKQIRSAEQSRLLTEIVGNMRQSMTQEGVLNTTVSELRYALKTDRVIVYRFHDDWNGTIMAESVAAGWRKVLGETVQDPFQEGLIDRYKNGRVRAMNDVDAEGLAECHRDILKGFQIRASIVAPVLQNGELIGLLCAHQCNGPREWQPEDIDLFTQLAIQLGFALDQTSLLEYTERARQEARQDADAKATEQQQQREQIQQRAVELLREVEPVSKGDLTVQARVTPDEVGTIAGSYNTIINSLRQIVEQVQSTSASVAATASSNESAVTTLSQDAKHQLQALNQALAQIQVMVESIQGVSQRAKRAERSVQLATQTLAAGDAAMDRTVSGISAIRETVAETAKKVKRLGEASQKISRVVSLINGFAAQTNLLALNAAIEAAKAGEEGQGFGVVAEEVRSLAQQSTAATAEIEHLVEEIQSQTNDVVAAMESGTDQVVAGSQLVEESRHHLSQISEVGAQLNQLVREIAQAAAVQTETSGTVSQTMHQVAAIAEHTSQQTATVADSFGHLLEVAKELQVSVAQFKVK